MNLSSFLDELTKIARTRYAREAANAVSSGDMGTFNQIADAHQRLGLGQREVKELGGGAEAGAFLNLGRAQGQTGGPNYHVQKYYNPESGITRGDETRKLVEMKKNFTDTARSMSPEARSMVPEMYGHASKNVGTPTQRTTSTHEFVPGMQSMRKMDNRGEQLDQVEKHVITPMKARGMSMGDTMREDVDKAGDPTRRVNFGNVVHSPTGPKVLDFLPHQHGTQYLPGQSFGKYAPNELKDNLEMSPRQAKAEFYNPKKQIHEADAMDQARAKSLWQRGGQVPDFEANAVPFHERQQRAQAQVQQAPTPRLPSSQVQPAAAAAPSPRPQTAAQSSPTAIPRSRTPAPATAPAATPMPTMNLRTPKPTVVPPKPAMAMHMPTTVLPKKIPSLHL